MTGGADATFDARMEALPATAAFVEAFCERHAIDAGDGLRLTLIVEELFTNIVAYGYGADQGGTIRLGLVLEGSEVRLVCEDRAPPYDPRPSLAHEPADLDDPVEARAVGGLGHWIVGRLVVDVGYVRERDANVVSLRFRRRVTPAR